MSFLTIAWSMVTAVCLTLALLHFYIWSKNRKFPATVLFSLAAVGAAGHAVFELIMLRATTVETYLFASLYYIIPLDILLVSLVWFVYVHFNTAKRWLALLITGYYAVLFVIHFTVPPRGLFSEISSLKRISLPWGEQYAVPVGTPNPLKYLAEAATVLMIIYFTDASLRLWRRGEQRRSLVIGGSIIFFMIAAGIHSPLVDAGIIQTPYLISFAFLAIVISMSMELSIDVVRSSVLSQEIIASERRFRSILEDVDLLVVAVDKQGIVSYVNPFASQLIGRPSEDIVGLEWIDTFVDESQRETARADFKGIVEKDIHHHHQNAIVIQNGELCHIA